MDLQCGGRVTGRNQLRAVLVTLAIEIHATGRLYGNIATPTLVIHENGLFDGSCKMEGAEEAAAEKASQAEASVNKEESDDDKIVDFRDKG